MIPDAKRPLRTWLLGRYVHWKVGQAFRGVWLEGQLPRGEEGLLAYTNHSSFWDGFIAHVLATRAGRDPYAMMEEHNLSRYRFLARLGAFSIRRHEAASSLESLRHARRVLRRPGSILFVFPQGQIEPNAAPPLRLERGVEVLARLAGVRCVPVAFRLAFFEHEYPDVLIGVGEPHPPAPLEEMSRRLDALVDRQREVSSPQGRVPLLPGRRSVAQRWDAVRGLS